MYVPFSLLVQELRRHAAVQSYNVTPGQIITAIEMLPARYDPASGSLSPDTLYLCEHWQFKRFDPRAALPPIVCVVESHAATSAVLFQDRCMAVVYGSTLLDVLLSLTNAAYDLGCKSSLITELSRSFLRCQGLEALMSEGYRALKNPLILTDRNQKILHSTDPDLIASPIYRDILASEYLPTGHPLVDALSASWNTLDLPFVVDGQEDLFPVLCKPLVVGTATIGCLHILEFCHPFDEQDANVAELLGNLLTIELWRTRRTLLPSPNGQRERFLRDVLDNLLGSDEDAAQRQKELGFTFQPHLHVLVFNLRLSSELSSAHRILFSDLVELLRSSLPGCTAFLYKNSVFALIESAEELTDFEAFLAPILPAMQQYQLVLGISNELPGVLSLREGGYQARKALQLGEKLHPGQPYYRYGDYSLHHLLELGLRSEPVSAFCPPQLQKLARYCQENGSELLDTLRVYLRCGRSKTEAAQQLYVHVNTVKYRIAQIQSLTGLDLNDDETALSLLLAFKMLEYREKFPSYEPILNE